MTRVVRAQREAIQVQRNRGLVTQFVIFVLLRGVDLGCSIAVLENAWNQSGDWTDLDSALFNTSDKTPPSSDPVDSDLCRARSEWDKKQVDSVVDKYDVILALTLFFNIVSITVFITHIAFWIAELKLAFRQKVRPGEDSRITRLTRNSLLSLMTAVIRDVPISCLNTELLALRSGRDGLVCIASSFARRCSSQSYVHDSLHAARVLTYLSFSTMLLNSLWKGVSGFYRLSRIREFQLHFLRACASLVFGFLYSITTFTPAMLVLIYRYFTIPGVESAFAYELAQRIVIVGIVIWIVVGTSALCCPILSAIRLTAD